MPSPKINEGQLWQSKISNLVIEILEPSYEEHNLWWIKVVKAATSELTGVKTTAYMDKIAENWTCIFDPPNKPAWEV